MIKYILIIIALSFSSYSEAAVDSEVERTEEVMTNISHQFIYAFFGKDILLYYLSSSEDISAIKNTSDKDLATLSRPFNSVIGSLFMAGLTMIYGITVGYFIVRLAGMLMELTWVAQRDGKGQLSTQEQRGLLLKILILGGLAVIPVPMKSQLLEDTFYTNLGSVLLFDFLGKANSMGDESVVALIDSQRTTMQTLKMPAADSKIDSMMALNSFFSCTRMQEARSVSTNEYQTKIPFYADANGRLQGVISVGGCSLFAQLGYDAESDKKIQIIKDESPSLPLEEGLFERAQTELYMTLLPDLFDKSMKVSKELVKPDYSSTWEDGNFSFEGHSAAALSVRELDDWTERCDEVLSWELSDETISRRDRVYFNKLSARCLSRIAADEIVYPDSYESMSRFLGNASKAQKDIALCVDQASMTSALGNSRFVAEYGIGSGDSRSSNIEQIALDSCISSLCSNANLGNGGMYACANALGLYETRLNDIQTQKRGTMMLGFYMFDVFMHHPPSNSAKKVFNEFSISFSPNTTEIKEKPGREPFIEIPITIPSVSMGTFKNTSLVLGDLSKSPHEHGQPTVDVPLPATGSLLSEAFGYTRLEMCAKNPLQVIAGYVCGNIPKEFSQFGMSLLKSTITLKTALVMGQTTGVLKRVKVNQNGSVSGFRESSALKSFLRKSGWGMMSLIGGSEEDYNQSFDSVFNMEILTTDEFGYLDSVKMNKILSSTPAMLLTTMAHAGATSAFVSIVDGILVVLLIISVIFAFVLPMFPMVMVMNALTKWCFLLFKTLSTHGKKLVDATFDTDFNLLNESFDKVWADWLALILKLPLTVIGTVLAWLMANVIISHMLNNMNLMVPTNDGVQGFIDLFVSMIVSVVIIVIVYNTVLSVIESFYDFTVEWVLNSMHNNPFSSNTKSAGWGDAKEVLRFMGHR